MEINEYKNPNALERYSFWWSEARLVIAAVALFLGGTSPVWFITPPIIKGVIGILLGLCWIVSGIVSVYLLYRWFNAKKMLFGGKMTRDIVAFFVNIISGLNLGITGVSGDNPGMSITTNRFIFVIVGLVYLWSALYLYRRFVAHGRKLF